jgi:hypothetical protein
MNVLVNVGAYDPIPSRGSVADVPGVHDDLPTKFLIKGAISPQEAVNAIEMIVGLRPDTDAKDKANKPLVTWEIKRPKEWINDKVYVWNLAD